MINIRSVPRLLQLLHISAMFIPIGAFMARESLQAEWIQLKDAALIRPKRSGHVSFTTSDGRLLVFGGYVEEGIEKNRKVTNDLWEWNNKGWSLVEQHGEIPGPRLLSAVGMLDHQPFLMGGWDPRDEGTGGIILDSIHRFDPNKNEWKFLPGVTLPDGPTSRHVCVSLPNNEILLHTHRCTEHVYLFDGHSFNKQPTTGTSPRSRGLHSAILLSETHVLIFAGAAQDGSMSNECFVLNTSTWEWNLVQVNENSPRPSPRASPCLCKYSNYCAVVFGGASRGSTGLVPEGDVWALQLDEDYKTGAWVLLVPEGPPPRNAASLNLISNKDDGTKEYLLHGGWAPFVETFEDCFILQVKPNN